MSLAFQETRSSAELSEIASVIMGQSPPSTTYNTEEQGIPFLQGKAEFGPVYPTPIKWCTAPGKVAEPNDVLMSIRAPVGPTNLAGMQVCIGRGLAAIRPIESIRPKWLLYALRSIETEIGELGTGTTFQSISGDVIRRLKVPTARLEEQDKTIEEIEKQFSRLDEAVANLKRVRANLRRYRNSVLQAAFEQRLPESAVGDQWPVASLSSVAEVQLGQQRAPVHAAAVEQLPYVRAANITWDGLDIADIKTMGFPNPERYRLQVGDILLSEASGSAKEVGKPAIWNGEVPGACYQKTLIRIRSDVSRLVPRFVYHYFLHTCVSGRFAKLAPGVGILHLTAERMLNWPIPVPDIDEQRSVVAELDRRLSIVRELEAEVDANLKRAQALRQAVLAKAFSGAHA